MSWLFPWFVLVCAGSFAKLSAAAMNWWFAHRLPKRIIVLTHLANISLVVGFTLLLTTGPGAKPLRAFIANGNGELLLFTWLQLAAAAVGLTLLVWSMVEFQLYAPPACQLHCETTRLDLRQQAGAAWRETFVGAGPMRRIALLPGNEQFSIEISTKSCSLPRLPAAWDGLSLVQLSDLHFRGAVTRAYFEAVCEQAAALKPDLFVFTGDLLDDPRLLDWLPTTLGKLSAPLGQYFILGNHDWYLDVPTIRREFERLGWTDLGGRSASLTRPSTTQIVLSGDETPWMGTHPDVSSPSSETFRMLLSHTPDNIAWARRHQIDLMLSGHTHGGQIRLPILGPVYSPSRSGCRYSAGVFWLEPTLLYVSRGISGREPIRYNCPPELTKLVLRSPVQRATRET